MSFETANQSRPVRKTPQRPERPSPRRPYDSSEIEKLPKPTDADPPYKSWWLDDDKKSS